MKMNIEKISSNSSHLQSISNEPEKHLAASIVFYFYTVFITFLFLWKGKVQIFYLRFSCFVYNKNWYCKSILRISYDICFQEEDVLLFPAEWRREKQIESVSLSKIQKCRTKNKLKNFVVFHMILRLSAQTFDISRRSGKSAAVFIKISTRNILSAAQGPKQKQGVYRY